MMLGAVTLCCVVLSLVVFCANIYTILGTSIDEHVFGIGKKYTFKSLTIENESSEAFEFSTGELTSLEKQWASSRPDNSDLRNNVWHNGAGLHYYFQLSDGFDMAWEVQHLRSGSSTWLHFELRADQGIGFLGEMNTKLIELDTVLSKSRLLRFSEMVTQ